MPSPSQRKQHDIRRSFWLDRPISHKYQFSLFESKREIIRVQEPETGEWEEQWTGDYIFENEWQSFRTKKDRSLELTSVAHECTPGRRKLAVKVVDIFGNDTMTVLEVSV